MSPSSPKKRELTGKQERAIIALCNEPTIHKAAAAVGVTDRTIHRWLNDPEFNQAYLKRRREAFSQAVGMAQRYANVLVTTLVKIAMDATASSSSRVTAAIGALRFGRESMELDDMSMRLETLELSAAEAAKK
jgi:hypothetical protein